MKRLMRSHLQNASATSSPGRALTSGGSIRRDQRGLAGSGDELGDLHGVERRALAQVVVADEQRKAAAAVDALCRRGPADVARVAPGGLQWGGDVGALDAGRGREQLRGPLDRERSRELDVQRER